MTIAIVVLLVLLLICLTPFLPCRIYGCYSVNKAFAYFYIGPIRFDLLKLDENESENSSESGLKFQGTAKEQTSTDSFWDVFKRFIIFLNEFRQTVKIKNLQFKLILAGSDPYNLSINYGRCWVVLGNLFPYLETLFTIQKRNLEIECDYLAESTQIDFLVDIRLPLKTLVKLLMRHGTLIDNYKTIKKEAKDGLMS